MKGLCNAARTAILAAGLLAPAAIQAQYAEGYTEIIYNEFTDEVLAFATTYVDYNTLYYYDPVVQVTLTKRVNNTNYWVGELTIVGPTNGNYALASVTTPWTESTTYSAYSTHCVDAYYLYYEVNPYCYFSCYDWYDCYGYSLLPWAPSWSWPSWVWYAPLVAAYGYLGTYCLGPTAQEEVTLQRPVSVSITSASIPEDRIRVALNGPPGASGTLTVEITGGTTHTVYQGAKAVGAHDISFNIPALPNGEFTQVRATWQAEAQNPSATYNYHFKVLGEYNNTRYNTPTESYCTGSPLVISYVSGTCAAANNCDFSTFQGKDEWWSRVELNGSGRSETPDIGVVSLEWSCPGPSRRARRVASPCPSCPSESVEVGRTVARNVSNADLPCGSTLYVHGVGTVTVTDSGGGLAHNQLDHYVGFGGCDRAGGSIGLRKVIRLF